MKVSEIKIKVTVDDNHIPIDIKWMATDSGVDHLVDCKAFNLSIWDPIESNSLGINLWTDQMRVDEMHAHFFRTLINMANSYQQSTGNPFAVEDVKAFCNQLAKKTNDWEESKK
ncbi:MAG: gliding motility protein GldC [Bacteroidetes bacterium]|nr:gliding motility protein GldC [Bacteroidota bacterium]MBP7477149.1 gliding motility protein GldC [Chitinophagales bacterium]